MIAKLPNAPLDVIGDVHGEHDALRALLARLGYAEDGTHPEGRFLVFVGDLGDRGPDSVGVFRRAMRYVEAGRALVALGNHELNILRDERKHGNGWFFNEDDPREEVYGQVSLASEQDRQEILGFLTTLPIALEREDLRVVHAAWDVGSVQRVREASASGRSMLEIFNSWERESKERIRELGLLGRSAAEQQEWAKALEDPSSPVPLLHAIAEAGEISQMGNPLRVLTSGVERKAREAFWASGKWRMVQREPWWDHYRERTPVIVGHFWRRFEPIDRAVLGKGDDDLFINIDPTDWHGVLKNVFCLDYSVGGRYQERRSGHVGRSRLRLAAMRWPERALVFDEGP